MMSMVIILMGVAGSGKSTIGELLAEKLNWSFYDADHFHPEENKIKQSQGIPLDDNDRLPWLTNISQFITQSINKKEDCVLACSALKHSYRKILRAGGTADFVFLTGSPELIKERIDARKNHFMNPNLLPNQFATLEEPKDAIYIDIAPTPEEIVKEIISKLELLK